MARVFYTSDLHLGHRLVSGLRGFRTADGDPDPGSHDAAIMENWSRVVRPDDIVWVLGDLDVANSPARVARMLDEIASLPGIKHLVPGNHDPVHPMHRDAHKWQRLYLDAFASVQPFARRKLDGATSALLSHFPYSADRGEVRYRQYRLRDEGMLLLHGHTHSAQRITSDHEIHVGVDAWDLAPVPQEVLAELAVDLRSSEGGVRIGR